MAEMIVTPPAPMLADVDWPRFRCEAEALAAELQAQYPNLTAREAGECAAAEVQKRYEAELAAGETHQIAAILDELVEAVDAAREAAQGQPRWFNAIDAAYDHLLQVETVTIDAHGALTYHSESGQTYKANGTCQCTAFLNGQPCKHRAAARLVRRALERRTPAPVISLAQRLTAARRAARAA